MEYLPKTYIGYDENNKEVCKEPSVDYNEIIDLAAIKNATNAVYEEAVYQSRKVIVPKLVDANYTARKALSGVNMSNEMDDIIEAIRTLPELRVQGFMEQLYKTSVDTKNERQWEANKNAFDTVKDNPAVKTVSPSQP